MDRMLAFIIIFLVVSIGMAAILAMGAIPQIFKSAEKIRETQQLVNQTQITLHEDQAREQQVKQILNQVKTITLDHHDELENYIEKQNNTTHKIIRQIQEAENQNIKILENQETVMKQHEQVSRDHNNITELVNNITIENNELLKKILAKISSTHQ